jgi:SAM-dependent methyltransferase
MSQDPPYFTLGECRVCGARDLVPFLDLGDMPLVNRYVRPEDAAGVEPRYPLSINFCPACANSQLSVVVSPEILYTHYDYQSSVSETFQRHCEEMARTLVERHRLGADSLVAEIASNDGCLLSKFQAQGVRVLGVEPARNLAAQANAAGRPTLNRFWGTGAAADVIAAQGKASLVVATNVVAHVHDLHGFFREVRAALNPDGVFVFEVPYMVTFINRTEFDTTYHEHLSYFLLKPLRHALEAEGLELAEAEEFDIHGGSIRVSARPFEGAPGAVPDSVARLLKWEEELGLHDSAAYLRFSRHVQVLKEELCAFTSSLKARGKRLAGFGASAKGNVLLNYCGLGRETFDYVVDDTPSKQGMLYPGNHLPIVSRAALRERAPDYLLILAWNFADEIIRKTQDYRDRGGRYILPIPSLRVI